MFDSGSTAAPQGAAAASVSTLHGLLTRRSVGSRHLVEPGPNATQIRLMAQAACRAPDHGRLRPFRFEVVVGAARQEMASLFAAAARDAGKDEPAAALDADRASRSPVTVAVVARVEPDHDRVTPQEQWMAVGGAIANFLNAAHLLGFAGQMLSGAKVRQPRLMAAFCAPGETLVGWIALGTSARPARGPEDDDRGALPLVDWATERAARGAA